MTRFENIPEPERSAIAWAINPGFTCRVKALDPVFCRTWNAKTNRRGIRFSPDMILPTIGDWFRERAMHWRVFYVTQIKGLKNPYL